MDYALRSDGGGLGATHRVSLGFAFGAEPERPGDLVLEAGLGAGRGARPARRSGQPLRLRPYREVAEAQKITMAIADLTAQDVSSATVSAMMETLSDELTKANVAIVLERAKMQALFAEQRFDASGCVAVECAQQMGKMLGVQVMLVGTLQKLEDQYRLTLRGVRVETGAVVGSGRANFGSLKELDDAASDALYEVLDAMGYTKK